jgi:hypothetical protein
MGREGFVVASSLVLGIFALASALASGCSRSDSAPGGLVEVAVMGEVGTSPGQFAFPRALDTDGESLWIIDKAGRVQRLRLDTGECVEYWGMPQTEFGKPTGVSVFRGSPTLLFIPDTHYQRVMVFKVAPLPPKGSGIVVREAPTPLTIFGKRGRGPGEFIYPTDIAILPTADGTAPARLYVSEYGDNDRVSVFEPVNTPEGTRFEFRFSFGVWGTGEDPTKIEFNRPQSLALDLTRRELIVADAGNHRLGRFTLDGDLVTWLGSREVADADPTSVHYPWAIQMLPDGTLLVVEQTAARLRRVDLADGRTLGVYGGPGAAPGRFATPWAVGLASGRFYVADGANNRVVSARIPTGANLASIPGATPSHGGAP